MGMDILVLVAMIVLAGVIAILSGILMRDDREDARLIGWKKQRWCE